MKAVTKQPLLLWSSVLMQLLQRENVRVCAQKKTLKLLEIVIRYLRRAFKFPTFIDCSHCMMI